MEIKTANIVDLLEFDEEWVELIIEAKNMGMQLEEVRAFLEHKLKDDIVRKND
ncbi:anti-repressor SinI family protein [Bacillus rubiinfantis]|uniref:anti-repressor SinI family protein n=1 Tax=Bacillus rubiinfantis TaxID=1499680 RepID=UPI000B13ED37|nr:anti-repressor SinI family protein [Bacillus rubiinfantis]